MIINSEHKFFFLHNPKVAGTSIRRRLFEYDDNPRRLEYQSYVPELERVVEVFHVCVGDIPAVWPGRSFDDYFKFGFVRNPYDRLFSSWAEHKRQHHLDPDTDFNEWAIRHLTPSNVRFDWRYTHFCPQHYFFYKNNELYADFIGRYEELAQGWYYVQAALGIPVESLGHSKDQTKYDTGRRLTMDDLTPEVLNLVNRIYERDFQLFGYTMNGKVPRATVHADIIDELASPLMHYSKDDDIRYLNLGQQCAYWRNRALQSEGQGPVNTVTTQGQKLLAKSFQAAETDPLGGWIAARNGVHQVNSGIRVGDFVKPNDSQANPLRSGAQVYPHAVCISVAPFILASEDADMRWATSVKAEDYHTVGRANTLTLTLCKRRLRG